MKSSFNSSLKLDILVSLIDVVAFNIGLFICFHLGIWPTGGNDELLLFRWSAANISYIMSLCFIFITLHHRLRQPFTVLNNTYRTSLLFIVLYAAILGMSHYDVPGFFRSLAIAFVVFVVISVERISLRKFFMNLRNSGYNNIKTIVLGDGYLVRKVVGVMNDPWSGYRLLGMFSDTADFDINELSEDGNDARLNEKYVTPHLGGVNEVMRYLESGPRVDEIYIGLPSKYKKELKGLFALCEQKMIRVRFIPYNQETVTQHVVEFGDAYVITKYNEPLNTPINRFIKRTFDVCFSLLFLCTLFPIIYVVVAIMSKITMPGPVFFKQERTGYDGKNFLCYKFRSMKVNVDADSLQATKDDPRVTKFGHFLRHSNIDELPQFFNVLKGDMSIVGPRPHMLSHTEYYSNRISDYMIRHYVKPGITGWAQTHGERGETKTVEDMGHRVEKDIWYIEHWNFWLDIQIIFKTVLDAVKGDKKAY